MNKPKKFILGIRIPVQDISIAKIIAIIYYYAKEELIRRKKSWKKLINSIINIMLLSSAKSTRKISSSTLSPFKDLIALRKKMFLCPTAKIKPNKAISRLISTLISKALQILT